MKIQSNLKAGVLSGNHNESFQVRTGVQAGVLSANHNESLAGARGRHA